MSEGVIGGTIVAIRARDGVTIAGEKRLSYGGFIISKAAKKIHPVTNTIGVGFAGIYGDMERLLKILRLEAQYYETEVGRSISVRSLAKYLSVLLFSYKVLPFYVETIVGGIDESGPRIYLLDPVGSLIEDKYVAAGTGAPIAMGLIEPAYRDNMNVSEAKELAVKAIMEAIERDAVSGDGVDTLVITSSGYSLEEKLLKR